MVVDVLASALSDLLFLGQAASTTAAAAAASTATTTVAPPPEATLEEELPGHVVVGEGNCSSNCSGRGICVDGECYCEIQYEGSDCRRVNFWYHVSFASIFSLVALTSLIQLVMCVHAEYIRLGGTSSKKQQQGGGGGLLWRACRVTTQKLLYLLIFLASLLRGAYFATAPTVDSKQLSASLMSAYYPLVLSGASLIVCFWAEVFHLREVRWDRPRFLSKSFLGFLAFNVITYSLLTAELMLVWMGGDEEGGSGAAAEGEEFYKSIFNGCYAVLMFVVVVFFLIYGVEVFFKVRGGFTVPVVAGVIASVPQQQQLQQQQPLRSEDEERQHKAEKRRKRRMEEGEAEAEEVVATLENEEEDGPASSRRGSSSSKQDEEEKKKFNDEGAEGKRRRAGKRLRINSGDEPSFKPSCSSPPPSSPGVRQEDINTSQLHQSRLGLLSQALMMMVTVGFLFSETLEQFWKTKVDLTSRNTHDLIFRTVEIGVALWFPCVLWNCIRPEQLWCLNPKKILNVLPPLREERKGRHKKGGGQKENSGVGDGDDCDEALSSSSGAQCWICYDGEDDTDDSEDSSYSSSSRASSSSSSSSSGGGRKNRRHRRRANRSLISPCQCKGDVGVVHHDCLKRWLVESADNPDSLRCKVCNSPYLVEKGSQFSLATGFTLRQWVATAAAVTVMCGSLGGGWAVVQLYPEAWVRMLAVGAALLVQYVCLRSLGLNTVAAYQRAKVSAMKIVSLRGGYSKGGGLAQRQQQQQQQQQQQHSLLLPTQQQGQGQQHNLESLREVQGRETRI